MKRKVKIVYGPPCSGKSTYCKTHMGARDAVFDYDAVQRSFHYGTVHEQKEHLRELTLALEREMVYFLSTNKGAEIDTFWFITRKRGSWVCKALEGYAPEYIEVKATMQECLDRLANDPTRPNKKEWEEIIRKYFVDEINDALS